MSTTATGNDESGPCGTGVTVHEREQFDIPVIGITTASGTWTYELLAGGFNSLRDPDGNEWIGFAPGEQKVPDGASNVFRGLPNLVHPDRFGHPGFRTCSSEWRATRDAVSIRTISNDGLWRWTWTVDGDGATLQVEAAPSDRAYWFLYEGTPAGAFSPDTAIWGTNADGRRTDVPRRANRAHGSWNLAWFGRPQADRVLAVHHETSSGEPSVAWWMAADHDDSDGMIVFGFGRTDTGGARPHLSGKHRFRVQLLETVDHDQIVAQMRTHGE